MIGEAVHLDDALQRNIGLGEEVLNLYDALLLHPAVWGVAKLLLKHIVEVLNTETTDVGKLFNGLDTRRIVLHERRKRLVAVEEVVEGAELNLGCKEELEDYEHLLNLCCVEMVALHIVLQVEAHRVEQKLKRLVEGHLRKFVVNLLDFAYNTIKRYHIARCTRCDEVGTHNLHIGEGRNLIVVGTETEDKMSLAHGVVATLLRGNLETTGHKEEDIVLVATLKDKFLTRLKGLIYKACFRLNGIGMTSCWTLIRHLGSGFWVSIFG